jgi:hypothetical protein
MYNEGEQWEKSRLSHHFEKFFKATLVLLIFKLIEIVLLMLLRRVVYLPDLN